MKSHALQICSHAGRFTLRVLRILVILEAATLLYVRVSESKICFALPLLYCDNV